MFGLGIRVIEVGPWATWAGRILADLGCEVVHLEPPAGANARHALFGPDGVTGQWVSATETFLERGKERVAIAWDTPTGLSLVRTLVESADLLLDGTCHGFLSWLERDTPLARERLRVVSVSPYGRWGPYHNLPGDDLLLYALSGQLYISGKPGEEPVRAPGSQSLVLAGLEGALAALALAYNGGGSASGSCDAEVAAVEVLAEMEHLFTYVSHQELVVGRNGGQHRGAVPGRTYPCADGHLHIFVSQTQPGAWDRFAEWIGGDTGWRADPQYRLLPYRQQRVAAIDAQVGAALAGHKVADAFEDLQGQKLPAAPVLTPLQALADPQFRARQVVVNDPQGRPALRPPFRRNSVYAQPGVVPSVGRDTEPVLVKLGTSRESLRSLAEAGVVRLGSVTKAERSWRGGAIDHADGPTTPPRRSLEGVRILDFSHMIAGPYATLQLAWLGAEVVKVESKVRPDNFRIRDGNPDWERSVPFATVNLGKRSITVNLKHAQGPELIRRLIVHCDAVVENFSKGVLERLDLGYSTLRRCRPDLIWLSLPGMGSDGPRSNYVTWGPSIMAFTGFTYLWNHPDQPAPVGSQVSYPDYLAGLFGAVQLVAALNHRRHTGEGSLLEIAQAEAAAYALGPAYQYALLTGGDLAPTGNRDPANAPQGCYPCQGDDQWLAVVVPDDATWGHLAEVIEEPWALSSRWRTLMGRLHDGIELDRLVADWTRRQEREGLWHRLQGAGVPSAPVLDARGLVADPHLSHRHFVVDVDHPVMGPLKMPGPPIRMGREVPRVKPAPLLGADNHYVFHDLLGMSVDEFERLSAEGAIG